MTRILSRFPNYADAPPLRSVKATDLDPTRFYNEFILHNRPCVIEGAATHWPAYARWGDVDYLKEKVADLPVHARNAPTTEYAHVVGKRLRAQLAERRKLIFRSLPFHEFLDLAVGEPDQLVLHALKMGADDLLGPLAEDISGFFFLPDPARPVIYPALRAFLYRSSYTDWHYHPADETFMTQVVGTKETLVLPPNQTTWNALFPAARATGFLDRLDLARFPKIADLTPFKVIVRPGDALYIPVFWWHAVESEPDDGFGVTVAATFGSPPHINGDPRFPALRRMMDNTWMKGRGAFLASVFSSYLRHKLRRAMFLAVDRPAS